MSVHRRICCLAAAVLVVSTLCGCGESTPGPGTAAASSAPLPSDDQLRAMIDDELNYTYSERSLDLAVHGAWQIMHGVLPFGKQMKVYNGDQPVRALQWVLDGHPMKGWTLQHGTEGLGGRRGLGSVVESGKIGQGHPEQWLSIMAQSGVSSKQKIIFEGREYEIRDMVQQALWESYEGKEASWDLTAFIIYLGPDVKWTASNGEEWTIERLVSMEARQDLATSACGGTHRLSALNKALKAHLAATHETKLTGAWKEADDKLRGAIEAAHRFQQQDGSFSTNFFSRTGSSPDPVAQMYSTGHTLEFLAMALPDQELDAPWVKRAVARLCVVFHQQRASDVECGSLYHAANGLLKYRQRRFGPWTFPDDPAAGSPRKPPGTKEAAQKDAGQPSGTRQARK